jgi:phospholipid/cholesterol/gamma-HCH transport system substrate-binding protein
VETRAHFVLIGAFVLCAVALAFLFILWLGQTQREYDEYDIVFTERVSGLSEGAAVRFNGIQKGEVDDLSIDPENPSIVVARIRVEKDTPVKTDTKAELELVGFTGLAIIQLVGGSPDKPLLKEEVRGVPRIRADTSGFAQFLAGTGDVLRSANMALSPENIAAFSRILANVDTLTKTLAEQDRNIAKTFERASVLTADLAETTARLKKISVDLETLVAEDAPSAMAEAQATLAETRAVIAEIEAIVEENREPIAAFTQGGLAQIGPAVAEARRLMRTMEEMLREIDRDPRGYIFGDSTPRYEVEQQ